jgi:small subunit ribosomal protein S20
MPIIKSAKKRMKQAEKRRAYNVAVKTTVKKQIKAVKTEVATGDVKSNKALILAIAQLDTAVKKGVLHKRTAARKKSRLTREYNAVAKKPFGTENPGKPGAKKTVKKTAAKKPAPKKTVTAKAPAKKATPKKK